MHRTVPPSTVLLNNVNRATIQKPCPRGSMLLLSLFSRVPDSVRSHRWQPMRLPHPWDSPGKNTGVGCHFLLQEMRGSIVACNFPNLPDHKSFLGEGTVLIKNTGPDLPWPTESDTPGLRPGNSYFKQLFWVTLQCWSCFIKKHKWAWPLLRKTGWKSWLALTAQCVSPRPHVILEQKPPSLFFQGRYGQAFLFLHTCSQWYLVLWFEQTQL